MNLFYPAHRKFRRCLQRQNHPFEGIQSKTITRSGALKVSTLTLLGGKGSFTVRTFLFVLFLPAGGAIQTVMDKLMDSFVFTGNRALCEPLRTGQGDFMVLREKVLSLEEPMTGLTGKEGSCFLFGRDLFQVEERLHDIGGCRCRFWI